MKKRDIFYFYEKHRIVRDTGIERGTKREGETEKKTNQFLFRHSIRSWSCVGDPLPCSSSPLSSCRSRRNRAAASRILNLSATKPVLTGANKCVPNPGCPAVAADETEPQLPE